MPFTRQRKIYGLGVAAALLFALLILELLTQYGDIEYLWLDHGCARSTSKRSAKSAK